VPIAHGPIRYLTIHEPGKHHGKQTRKAATAAARPKSKEVPLPLPASDLAAAEAMEELLGQ